MSLARKLAGSIFFKIILAFVVLTFILFGVSDFILGGRESWVVKVGSKTISANAVSKVMQTYRDRILSSRKDEEVMKYLESAQFKSEIVQNMVNDLMIKKVTDENGIKADKQIILESIARDPNFRGDDGKFDHKIFESFLKNNKLNEEKYVGEMGDKIAASIILQSISAAAPINQNIVVEMVNFEEEKRIADITTLSLSSIKSLPQPEEKQVEEFFTKNKSHYLSNELRTVSYTHFSKDLFAKDFTLSDAEVMSEYESNKDKFLNPESRDLLHVKFDDESKGKEFLQELNEIKKSGNVEKSDFVKLAKKFGKGDEKSITIAKATKEVLIPELSNAVFTLDLNQHSEVLQSPLGSHIFLVIKVNPSKPVPFAKVRDELRKSMLAGREEEVLHKRISEINDSLLVANSLDEISTKFKLKKPVQVVINQTLLGANGKEVSDLESIGNFSENVFALKKGQTSQVILSSDQSKFYIVKIEEVEPARELSFTEARSDVLAGLLIQTRQLKLKEIAAKLQEEISKNPAQAAQIATRYGAKFDKNREFPRVTYVNFQGRQIAYPNQFLDELFKIKINETTPVVASGQNELTIGVLKGVKKHFLTSEEKQIAEMKNSKLFRNEIVQEYNSFLLKKYPIQVNEKFFESAEQESAGKK